MILNNSASGGGKGKIVRTPSYVDVALKFGGGMSITSCTISIICTRANTGLIVGLDATGGGLAYGFATFSMQPNEQPIVTIGSVTGSGDSYIWVITDSDGYNAAWYISQHANKVIYAIEY